MKRNWKRILAMLLCAAMVMTMNTQVFAADSVPADSKQEMPGSTESVSESGSAGIREAASETAAVTEAGSTESAAAVSEDAAGTEGENTEISASVDAASEDAVSENIAGAVSADTAEAAGSGETWVQCGDFYVSGGTQGTDYSLEGSSLTVKTGTHLTISGLSTTQNISLSSNADVTIRSLSINLSSKTFAMKANGSDIQLTLEGKNVLIAGEDNAGLDCCAGHGITISGDGSLEVSCGNAGAGIGGGAEEAGGSISINGGTISAASGYGGAGIGGGHKGAGGSISITGGTISAASGYGGAGIGGGSGEAGGSISITGGIISAAGGYGGSGIGGGSEGTGGRISINGGTISAAGGDKGAGIGGGHRGTSGTIRITGSTINATGGKCGAGIGNGSWCNAACGTVSICDSIITAKGGDGGAGIGGGWDSSGGTVIVNGGQIRASNGGAAFNENSAGEDIGHGQRSNISLTSGTCTISNAIVTRGSAAEVSGNATLIESIDYATNFTVDKGAEFTVPAGRAVSLNGGTFTNNGTIKGNGTISGSGTFTTMTLGSGTSVESVPDMDYTCSALTPAVTVSTVILGETFTVDSSAYSTDYTYRNEKGESISEVKEPGTYSVTVSDKGGNALGTKKFYVNSAWQKDYTYRLDGSDIVCTKYKGSGKDIVVPATAVISGNTCNTVLQTGGSGVFFDTTIHSISINKGVHTGSSCSGMFSKSIGLSSLDLSGLDTAKATNMQGMFYLCQGLTSLDLSSFDTSNVTNMTDMLKDCTGIKKLKTPKTSGTVTAALPYTMYDKDGTPYTNLPVNASSSITLYTLDLRHTVSFNDAADKSVSSEYVFDGNVIKVPEVPTGYSYGVYTTSACDVAYDLNKTVSDNMTIYLKKTPVDYAITYDLAGGTNAAANPADYTIETADIALAAPTRQGYIFKGWTGSNGTAPQTAVTIAEGSYGNKSYKANWTADALPLAANMKDAVISAIPDQTYTGAQLMPEPVITLNGLTLAKDRDYTLSYSSNTNVGTAKITIKGINEVSGTRTVTFNIVPQVISETSAADINILVGSVVFTKTKEYKPAVTVYVKGRKISSGLYTTEYADNTAPGTGKVTITFKANAKNLSGSKTAGFKIINDRSKLINSNKTGRIADQTYTGSALKPTVTIYASDRKTPLTLSTDYTVDYINNMDAGTATAIITGTGEYAGVKSVNFKIRKAALTKDNATVTVAPGTYYCTGYAIQPDVTVSFNGRTLDYGTDYTVKYSNNVNAATDRSKARCTVYGTGSYSGKLAAVTFEITAYDWDAISANISAQAYTGKALKPEPEFTVNGQTVRLKKGSVYSVSYAKNMKAGTATAYVKGAGSYRKGSKKTVKFEIK